jgi:CheY-like chemotaxis protein
MESGLRKTRLLLVDDDEDFRQSTSRKLSERGFDVAEAARGEEAVERVSTASPDLVLLGLERGGVGGIETLQRIRQRTRSLPVVILTGHGNLKDALAGFSLEIADFLHKPIGPDELVAAIRSVLARPPEHRRLREKTIAELMVSPSLYPRVYADQPIHDVFHVLVDSFLRPPDEEARRLGLRSALVFDREDRFRGLVRFSDLLKLVLPGFMSDSPYFRYFTGMFVAQCKLVGQRTLEDIMGERVSIDVEAPLMEAVQLMVTRRVISVPVMRGEALAGVLRERDVVLEISREMAGGA